MRPLLVRSLLAGALTLLPNALTAQTADDLSRARQLFSQGVTQEAAGDWAGALATFQDVARIKMTPQVRFHIARCKEHLGRLNEALGGYRLAEHEASELGDKATELLEEVQRSRVALEARVPKLVIERGPGASAARVELDGVAIGEAQIGTEISIDPGPHVVAGILPGGKRFEKTVDVAEGETERITLEPEGLEDDSAAPPVVVDGGDPEPPRDAPAEEAGGSALPWVIGGVGVASLVASAVFFKMKSDAEDELSSGCLGRTCPDTLEDTQSRGETYATLTGVTLGIGIVGVGVATVLLLTGRSPGPEQTGRGVTFDASLGSGSASIDLSGRF